MAPNVFIAGQDYCDRIRYLHYGGMNVTIVDPPGGAKLVYDLLSQLRERLGSDTFGLEPIFVKRETVAPVQGAGTVQRPVQTALEVEQLAPNSSPGHRVKSRLQLQCETSAIDGGLTVSIKTGDLLVVVDQHDVGSFEVDPWYRIFRRSGADIAQSDVEWDILCKYATSFWLSGSLPVGWEPIGVVIDAEYLRWKDVEISRHLSWAQTTEDLFRNFVFNGRLKPELNALRTASHLIVRFDCDGVIHVDNTTEQGGTADLYIQKSENSEGDFIQSTPGRTPAIVAGFMAGLLRYFAQQKTAYNKAIQSGLVVSQKAALAKIKVESGTVHHYELDATRSAYLPTVPSSGRQGLAVSIPVPCSKIKEKQYRWSILRTMLEGKLESERKHLEEEIEDYREASNSEDLQDIIKSLTAIILQPSTTDTEWKKSKVTALSKTIAALSAEINEMEIEASIENLARQSPRLSATDLEHEIKALADKLANPHAEPNATPEQGIQGLMNGITNSSETTEIQAKIKDLVKALKENYTNVNDAELNSTIVTIVTTIAAEFAKTKREKLGPEVDKLKNAIIEKQSEFNTDTRKKTIDTLADRLVRAGVKANNTRLQTILRNLVQIAKRQTKGDSWNLEWETKALANRIVKEGSQKALANIPTARFGNLMTADRQEKESFRAIANLVTEYLRSPQEKPISIGVFGAPGSGKSFGIKEVVKAVAQRVSNGGKRVSKPLTFNLSQFREYHDLVVAFHTVRDSGLSNEVPLVLFDEFDSGFGQTKLGWLQYLLAPMQDGKFLEDGHQRPLGSAIFVFIGGTCSTFEDFTTDLATKDAKDAKKPDFVSRLRGFVNIQGSHQSPRDTDYMYLVRRGIHLRAMLQNRLGCKADEEIQLDDGVLNALLTVPQFRHGARSLESIIAMSQLHGQKIFRRSALPSAQQLGLHVDYTTFVESFEPENHRAIARVKIAERIRILGRLPPEDDFRQRIAGQILDMIYNNGAYLVPQPPNESRPEDAEDHPKRKALVNDLAKYRYYAVNLHNSIYAWGDGTPADRNTYIAATNSLLELLKGCGFAVRKGS